MKKYLSSLTALVLVGLGYVIARLPSLSSAEAMRLASHFAFQEYPLSEVSNHPPYKAVRRVHPSLERISAWVSSMGAAATLSDLDGNGLPDDLVYVDPRTDLVTVTPVPDSGMRYAPFTLDLSKDASAAATGPSADPVSWAPTGTLAGDFNEDGRMDVLVYFYGRTPLIFLRQASDVPATTGDRRGTALSAAAFSAVELVTPGERWYSTCAVQADLDGDGHVDLLIGNYFQDGARILDSQATGTEVMHSGKARALNGGYKHVFLWQAATGGGTPTVRYREVRDIFTEEVGRGWTLAMGAADLDGDLLPEIYLANDFGPDRLLHNRSTPGHLQFGLLEGVRDLTTPKSCVLGHDSFKSMGVDFGDVNGDGLLDIYVSNLATRFGLTESHFLWLSTGATNEMKIGRAPYLHGSERLGLARSGFAFEARLVDFDNDGRLEAMQACGFIKGKVNRWPELQALGTSNNRIVHDPRFWPSFRPGADLSGEDGNAFFVADAKGRYHNLAGLLGLATPRVCRGIAIADVDGDGRMDFVTANQWGPSYFIKNQSPDAGTFLGLHLVHANGSPAIGAVARLNLPGGRQLVGQVDGGTGHSGRRSPDIHFGLGRGQNTLRLETSIQWRDDRGTIQRTTVPLAPGWHTLRLADGKGDVVRN